MTETRRFGPYQIYKIRPPAGQRIRRLLVGLFCFGVALGLSVEADLGVNPWMVFHQGLATQLPISIGMAIVVAGLVIIGIFPLVDEPIGLGTVLNVTLIGVIVDLTISIIPTLDSMPSRVLALGVSPILIGLGTGFYIGSGLGPGPRDGLMTALERRGLKVSVARTAIEFTALTVGVLLGGRAGWGTLYMAGTVGFWVQLFLKRLRLDPAPTT